MKRHSKGADGKYHINGKTFDMLEGSRAQVWHETAYKTAGGLTRFNLVMNKHGRVVSKKKHDTAKKEKRLQKHGYFTKKGKFGYVKKSVKKTSKKGGRKTAKKGGKRSRK